MEAFFQHIKTQVMFICVTIPVEPENNNKSKNNNDNDYNNSHSDWKAGNPYLEDRLAPSFECYLDCDV